MWLFLICINLQINPHKYQFDIWSFVNIFSSIFTLLNQPYAPTAYY